MAFNVTFLQYSKNRELRRRQTITTTTKKNTHITKIKCVLFCVIETTRCDGFNAGCAYASYLHCLSHSSVLFLSVFLWNKFVYRLHVLQFLYLTLWNYHNFCHIYMRYIYIIRVCVCIRFKFLVLSIDYHNLLDSQPLNSPSNYTCFRLHFCFS